MVPDDERLERLIGAAFDRLPEPAPSRLKAVEDRLVAGLPQRPGKRRTPGFYWWLAAMLVANGAAAWWAGERFYTAAPEPAPAQQTPAIRDESPVAPSAPAREQSKDSPNIDPRTNQPPAIYKKEQY